jgi:hypothetical protein
MRTERERAQRISEYVDGLVVHRREGDRRSFSADDREFGELTALARVLSSVELRPPDGFADELRDELPRAAAESAAAGAVPGDARASWLALATSLGARLRWLSVSAHLRKVTATAVLVALCLTVGSQLTSTPTASAQEILSRADRALAQLVHRGQVLQRRWKVTDHVKTADGVEVSRQSIVNEWMDGSDFSRVAGRNETNGRVYLAYATTRENGEVRPRVYFAPGFSNETRGLLSIEPTRREFQDALASFGPHDRAKLKTYLSRGYIFEPISGERRFNRIALETSTEQDAPLPRVMVSLREETLPSGTQVYAVRIVDPARVRFRWKSVGPPMAWLEWRETVRYIARDTYLSLKAEEIYENEQGRRVFTTRELIDTRIVEHSGDDGDPFVLAVPDDTPVRRQSASEQLAAVAAVLQHVSPRLTR